MCLKWRRKKRNAGGEARGAWSRRAPRRSPSRRRGGGAARGSAIGDPQAVSTHEPKTNKPSDVLNPRAPSLLLLSREANKTREPIHK